MAYSAIVFTRISDQRYLLQQRDCKIFTVEPGKWGLFGGYIEPDETPKEAIIREVKEELEIKLKESDLKFLAKSSFNSQDCFVFSAEFKEDYRIQLNEGDNYGFFSILEILNLETVRGIKEYFIKNK